jgi:hypothetical protein
MLNCYDHMFCIEEVAGSFLISCSEIFMVLVCIQVNAGIIS